MKRQRGNALTGTLTVLLLVCGYYLLMWVATDGIKLFIDPIPQCPVSCYKAPTAFRD